MPYRLLLPFAPLDHLASSSAARLASSAAFLLAAASAFYIHINQDLLALLFAIDVVVVVEKMEIMVVMERGRGNILQRAEVGERTRALPAAFLEFSPAAFLPPIFADSIYSSY